MPRVSVIMPVYNVEKYVGEAIESILNQTFTDFEFVIINDGSTDDTASIIKQYAKKDKRIKFVNHSKNKGLIAVLNEGLGLCRGEYVARMDSDDISLQTRFEKQIAYMDKHPECVFLGAWCEKFGENITKQIFKYRNKIKLFDLLVYGCNFAHPTAMIRNNIVKKYKINYDINYPHAEDYAIWSDFAKYTEIHNLQEVLLNRRWHASNVSVLHENTQKQSAERVRKNILKTLLSDNNDIQKFLRMTREINEHFYLFGILPIIRRKQYSITKTKYYLFDKIPLIKERDGKIYLFEFIKIGSLR